MDILDIKAQFDMIESKPPKCDKCLDTGLYFPAGFDKGVTICDCKRQERIDSLTRQLPSDYRDVYFKEGFLYKGTKQLGIQLPEEKKYLESLDITTGKGLTWQGVNRTGKSTRAVAMCQAINGVYWRDMDLAFYNDIMLVSSLRSEEFGGPEVLDFIRHATVLFIDDFGASKPSDWVSSALYGVIDERRANLRPVFITTNYSSKQISERLERGAAITGRLREVNTVITLNEKR
jgi:DNA replication protein DnaC